MLESIILLGRAVFWGLFLAPFALGALVLCVYILHLMFAPILSLFGVKAFRPVETKKVENSTKENETTVRYSGYWVDPVTGESLNK